MKAIGADADPSVGCMRDSFSPTIIAFAIWLYVGCILSLREDEEMLLEHGIDVS